MNYAMLDYQEQEAEEQEYIGWKADNSLRDKYTEKMKIQSKYIHY